jgi:hypothetical protein
MSQTDNNSSCILYSLMTAETVSLSIVLFLKELLIQWFTILIFTLCWDFTIRRSSLRWRTNKRAESAVIVSIETHERMTRESWHVIEIIVRLEKRYISTWYVARLRSYIARLRLFRRKNLRRNVMLRSQDDVSCLRLIITTRVSYIVSWLLRQ